MTPDTTAYMIAGFAVILAGILVYVLSLFFRIRAVRTQSKEMEDLLENSIDISERLN